MAEIVSAAAKTDQHSTENDLAAIEAELKAYYDSHPDVVKLRQDSSTLTESRTLFEIDAEYAKTHYTAAVLSGTGRVSVSPFVAFDESTGTLVAIYHLGTQLAGHRNLLHGGVGMTLLDECLGKASLAAFSDRTAVTAGLEVKFQRPVPLPTIVSVKASVERSEGRKAFMKGGLYVSSTGSSEGEASCMEATALYIQPKMPA